MLWKRSVYYNVCYINCALAICLQFFIFPAIFHTTFITSGRRVCFIPVTDMYDDYDDGRDDISLICGSYLRFRQYRYDTTGLGFDDCMIPMNL